ncbi:exonuclease domain-containing protein [Persicobacter sp. CCB-QB2]|uniref:exonuclease domain-containing protein n=1 Tax=Persicobacter sp. CCB-QB2 TaxID=1561025 RepID=UPI0006A97EAC|nr:exonuclease domain-containing protein [Persicobacter sp. CCB-QB2]
MVEDKNFPKKYAIIDIETTGGNTKEEKITEIAIFIHDGEKVIQEFSSLINPEKNIPYHITRLTGIDNEMVADAPRFFEVAKEIVEITEDCIFVAHNVGFDYQFVRQEFKSLGFEYKRPTLCTVKMSRALLPGFPSYSLGKLTDRLGIHISARHRAFGDAEATVKLFEILLEKDTGKIQLQLPQAHQYRNHLHPKFQHQDVEALPEDPGVYYFLDEQGQLLYIGKSINIHKRVLSHLYNTKTKKAIQLKSQIVNIDFVSTGNELAALLLESHEIKKNKPPFNRALRRSKFHYQLFAGYNLEGYITFNIAKDDPHGTPIYQFSNRNAAQEFMFQAVEKYDLCQKLSGLYKSQKECFNYTLKRCKGACLGKEEVNAYNQRAQLLLDRFQYDEQNFLLVEDGRQPGEYCLVLVENGVYQGFGYVEKEYYQNDVHYLRDFIQAYENNRDTHRILLSHLRKKKKVRMLKWN